MRNIKLTIQYDGTNYSGWQFQKNAKSVQAVLERALKNITGQKTCLVASGRTDAGVHARAQVANFKTRSRVPVKNLMMALNTATPEDIKICNAEEVDIKFNAQHAAKSKLYRYTIANSDFVDPFIRDFSAKCFYKLDIKAMKKASRFLLGRHDFRSFQTTDGRRKNAVRTIKHIKIEKCGDLIYIDIEANGFLYNMVRAIAGTLIEVGRGKMSPGRVKVILSKKNRRFCGPTMPAKGLCLINVRY